MRKPVQYECDVCQAVKGEVNHWFVIEPRKSSSTTIGQNGKLLSFMVTPWTAEGRDHSASLHVCGQQCLQKKIAELSQTL